MYPMVPLAPGAVVADYRLLAVIGSGTFGITYLATSPRGSLVAFKEFAPMWCARRGADAASIEPTERWQRSTVRDGVDRFLAEAAMLAPIEHPNIVRVERTVEANNTAYMVMAHVVGGTLSDRLRTMTRLPAEAFVLAVHDGVSAAVQALHDRGILHRDIRTPNVLLAADGTPVLADFSLARAFSPADAPDDAPVEAATQPAYDGEHTGPLQGLPQTASVDIYGLASLLYHVVTGHAAPRFGTRQLMTPVVPLALRLSRWFDPRLLAAADMALNCDVADLPQSLTEWRRWITRPLPPSPGGAARTVAMPDRPPYQFTFDSATEILGPGASAQDLTPGAYRPRRQDLT